MIAKGKAVAHGKEVLNYIFREKKLGTIISSNQLASFSPEDIYEEMRQVSQFNSRCKNKFLRFEIGIAPEDEPKLGREELKQIVERFAEKMQLSNQQWIAVTHKDTDNLHIHLVANRIGVDNAVYQTDFVSNRASRAAEEISQEMQLTIAKEKRRSQLKKDEKSSRSRNEKKAVLRAYAYAGLKEQIREGKTKKEGLSSFLDFLRERKVQIIARRNKKGNIYGLCFLFRGEVFKASEIGREFGYHSLLKQFGIGSKIEESQRNDQSILQNNSKLLQSLFETAITEAENITESIADLLDSEPLSVNYKEINFQKKMRRLYNNKKRGRSI